MTRLEWVVFRWDLVDEELADEWDLLDDILDVLSVRTSEVVGHSMEPYLLHSWYTVEEEKCEYTR